MFHEARYLLIFPEDSQEELVPDLVEYPLPLWDIVDAALHQEIRLSIVVTRTLLLTVVVPIIESNLSIGRMHDPVSILGVIVHEAFDLIRPRVLDISLAPSIFWDRPISPLNQRN